MALEPILDDDKKPIPSLFWDAARERVVEVRRVGSWMPGGGIVEKRFELYVRPQREDGQHGGFFSFPIQAGEGQTISRWGRPSEDGNDPPVDIYLAKGFRFARSDDVRAWRKQLVANEAQAAARKRAADPMYRDQRVADLMADAIKSVVAGGRKAEGAAR